VSEGRLLAETPACEVAGLHFTVFEVPGHCPGSLCFYFEEEGALFGGDVLFRGGIGRWDLPGGDHELLITGIVRKILPLPDATKVYPGHGPATTVGRERATNPFLR
jgi:glyoxylase-like metal-dependent hydrolase (beta-lactamase superfamily II)